jgi:hypothetical protein
MRADRPPHESPEYRYVRGDRIGSEVLAQNRFDCVAPLTTRFIGWQCTGKRGHGYKGLYCKQHAKKYPVTK